LKTEIAHWGAVGAIAEKKKPPKQTPVLCTGGKGGPLESGTESEVKRNPRAAYLDNAEVTKESLLEKKLRCSTLSSARKRRIVVTHRLEND